MTPQEIPEAEGRLIAPIYQRAGLIFERGAGAYLFDHEGRRYLDFAAGIAVNALGHADPELVAVVREQAGKLIHLSNLYYSAPQLELAHRLVERSFADRVFFCNSGAEANDAAVKFARKYARVRHGDNDPQSFQKTQVLAFDGCFHGRTIGSVSFTGTQAYRDDFEPLMPDVVFAPFNDLDAARRAVGPQTCAVILETIKGQGGVIAAEPAFLRELRRLCNEHDALLILDEVQCGLGRTGRLWAHEEVGVDPDIMTIAKSLAGGLPMGATLTTEAVGTVLRPGDHGCTFAGGPLVSRAAQVVVERVSRPEFLADVAEKGRRLRGALEDLGSPEIAEVRGAGLFVGVELRKPVAPVIRAAQEAGVLLLGAGRNVLRLCPPLIVTGEQIDEAVRVIGESIACGAGIDVGD